MILRNMESNDYDIVIGIMKQVHSIHVNGRPDIYKVELDFSYEKYLSYLSDSTKMSLVSEIDGVAIGIAFLTLKEDLVNLNQKIAFLDIFCIDYRYSDKGKGKEFMYAIELLLKVRGVTRLELAVWQFNEKAQIFYNKMGFKKQRVILEKSIK